MKKRGQIVRLKNPRSGQEVLVEVVLPDTKQGYLGIRPDKSWFWFLYNDGWEEVK
jgi:hypothetical protein